MPRPLNQLPAPSKTDLEILAVLWDHPAATGRAIYDTFLDTGRLRRRIAYTTIKTYLDRLVQKGYIDGHPSGDGRGTYRYTAAVSRAEMRDHPDLLARLVRVLRLTPAEFTQWCAAHGHLSQADQAALRALLHHLPEHPVPPAAAAEPQGLTRLAAEGAAQTDAGAAPQGASGHQGHAHVRAPLTRQHPRCQRAGVRVGPTGSAAITVIGSMHHSRGST